MGEPAWTDLHERDFYAWTQDQAARLRALAGDNRFDAENVAEEIAELGASALAAVKSHIQNMFVHLLKLAYSPATDPRAHWIEEVLRHQSEAELYYTAAMRQDIDLDRIWRKAVRRAHVGMISYGEPGIAAVPPNPFTLDDLLAADFDPNDAEARLRAAIGDGSPSVGD
jgi:hypothetical protein